MRIVFTEKFVKALTCIQKKDSLLFERFHKQLKLFQENPDHPSLRLHKLSGVQADTWSISLDMSQRMLFYYQEDKQPLSKKASGKREKQVVFFAIGKHEEVYK